MITTLGFIGQEEKQGSGFSWWLRTWGWSQSNKIMIDLDS